MTRHNKNPISLREGKVFLDGVEIMDSVACTINATPDTWEGRTLGEKVPSTRWLGMTITGSITRRKSTPWLKKQLAQYLHNGITPEFEIQGYMNDKNSDYFRQNGTEVITCVGCVITGEIPLTALDSSGEVVDEVINFNAKNIV